MLESKNDLPIIRSDKGTVEKVAGANKFTSDLSLPGMLYAKALYAEHPRARILHVDTSKAAAIEGVVAVVTHKDMPAAKHWGTIIQDQPVYAIDEVHYVGDMIAAVVAESLEAAQAGVDAVEVEYEVLPGVYDVLEAFDEGSIPARADLEHNIRDHHNIVSGDVEQAFENADVVAEGTFRTQTMEHLFLETEAAIADWDGEQLTLYASGQHPHGDRAQVAKAMGLDEDNVRVIYPYIGGGFGGKEDMHIQVHTAAMAHKVGRPVKYVRTRNESMFTHAKRPVAVTTCAWAADKHGTLQGFRAQVILEAGPYTNLATVVAHVAAELVMGPYNVSHTQIDSYSVATNNLITGAFRGFGGPEAVYSSEQVLDMLAEKLDMDPLELRLKNVIDKGSWRPSKWQIPNEIGARLTIERAAEESRFLERESWLERQPAPNLRRGIGVATILHEPNMGRLFEDVSNARLEMTPEGRALLFSGSADLGQGSYRAQTVIAAKVLGLEVGDIDLVMPDTEITLDASVTSSSRQVYMTGNAVLDAAEKIRGTLFEIASEVLESSPDQLLLEKRVVWSKEHPERVLKLSTLAAEAWNRGLSLREDGRFGTWHARNYGKPVEYPHPYSYYSYATHIVQVLVDTETGHVTVEKLWAAHDVGKAIDPEGIKGQIDGGVLMGIGYALYEELIQHEGRLMNSHLSEYVVPMAAEMCKIVPIIIEVPEPTGPFGAKGVGEPVTSPVAPAIANAVADAIGVRLHQIPMTPERVWAALQENNANTS